MIDVDGINATAVEVLAEDNNHAYPVDNHHNIG